MTTPRALVINGRSIVMRPCSLYAGHASAVIEAHHICPKSWWLAAGKPVNTPMRDLCGLCHNNVHAAIDALVRGLDPSALPVRCRSLAAQAMSIAAANGLTPAVTL